MLKRVSGILLLTSLTACTKNTQPALELHQMTNPHTAGQMQEMAKSLRHILDLYVAEQNGQVINPGDVVIQLNKLEAFAQSSRNQPATGSASDESSLTPYLSTFMKEIATARAHASLTQADIKPAAELINNCLACHKEL